MDYNNLLIKYLKGECTPAEAQALFSFFRSATPESIDPAMRKAWEQLQHPPVQSFPNRHQLADRVLTQISAEGEQNSPRTFHWVRYAAAVVLLVGAAYLGWSMLSVQTYQTGYGQTQTVILPDSSVVTLNANSRLDYRYVKSSLLREVTLEGEAFFRVKSIIQAGSPVKFTVFTNNLDIEVLGTEFNVHHRHGDTEVVLEEGKVKVSHQSQELLLDPGERVELKKGESQLTKMAIELPLYTGWRNNLLVFEQTSLAEIAQILEDQYDLTVLFDDPKLARKTFRGTYPADDISILLKTLEKSVDIQNTEGTLHISEKKVD